MGFLSKLNPLKNPLPGITGGLPGVTNTGLLSGTSFMPGITGEWGDIPTSFGEIRNEVGQVIDNTKSANDEAVRNAGAPARASGVDYLQWADERAQKFNNALSTDAAENAKLAVNTTSLNDGILEKSNRAEVTRMNPAFQAKLQAIGSALAASGIPIASQAGLALALATAARRREAGLLNNRQFGTSVAGTLLGAYGPDFGGGWQGAAMRGGAGGAIGAYGSGRPIIEGALTGAAAGGLGNYLSGVGQQYDVNPALTRAGVGAVTGGVRGGSEGAYAGGVSGLFSGLGGELGGRYGAQVGGMLAGNYLSGERADSRRNQAISAMQQRQQQSQQPQQAAGGFQAQVVPTGYRTGDLGMTGIRMNPSFGGGFQPNPYESGLSNTGLFRPYMQTQR